MRRLLTILGLLLAVAAADCVTLAQAAERIRTRAAAHPDYGRMVFDWKAPVGHRATIAGDRLTIVFDRSFETDFRAVRNELDGYVSAIGLGDDGKTVHARLTSSFRVRSFDNEGSVVVDLVRDKRASGAEPRKVGLRFGEHSTFDRIVFDWPISVGYHAALDGGTLTVKFDRPATLDLTDYRKDPPKRLTAATARMAGNGAEAVFDVPAGSRIRHFRDGPRVVVDVLDGVGQQTARRPMSRAPLPPSKADATGPQGSSPIVLQPIGPRTPPKKVLPPRSDPNAGFRPLVSVDAKRDSGLLEAKFNWLHPVRAAAYRRGESLWLAFERPVRIDLGGLRVVGRGLVESARQVPDGDLTLVRLGVSEHLGVSMRRDGDAWVLVIGPKTFPPAAPITVKVDSAAPGGLGVALNFAGDPALVSIRDPDVGDELRVLLTEVPGQGHAGYRRFVGFDVLPSPLGVAIRPAEDGLGIHRDGHSLKIDGDGPLAISRGGGPTGQPVVQERSAPMSDIWGAAEPDEPGRKDERQALLKEILQAPPQDRNRLRIALARANLNRGFDAEAEGILRVTERQNPTEEERLEIQALTGVANYLLGHYADAAKALSAEPLRDAPETAPWLGAIAAARGDWRTAHEKFSGAATEISALPAVHRIRLKLLAAEAALAVDDLKSAEATLSSLSAEPLTARDRDAVSYLEAFLMKKRGKLRQALETWHKLQASKDRRVRARAAMAAINAEREAGRISPKDAADELEKLSFAWRGDSYEFDRLTAVAKLYAEIGDYRHALTRYRQAASYFGDVEGAKAITDAMSHLFRRLYLEGGADDMQPVTALALYREFRELTPSGPDGDEMIRKLAERLVSVDLLDEAAKLLDEQIAFRLKGVEKARVGTRLATIRLLNRQEQAALDALDKSAVKDMPPKLVRERRNIRAQALSRLNREADALAVLTGDDDRDTDILRLSVLWRAERWADVSKVAARLLAKQIAAPANAKIDENSARFATIWAVAAALTGDTATLDRLRTLFRGRMDASKSRYLNAFNAIVGRGPGDVPDYKALAERAADLEDFQAFLDGYKARDNANGKSAPTQGPPNS